MEIQTFVLTPFGSNCYVVRDGGEALVIDAGEADEGLLASLEDVAVNAIVNTHCHIDHCCGNAGLKAATGAPLWCHEDEVPLLHCLEQQGMMFGVPSVPSPDPDRFLKAGETLTVGGAEFEVRLVPGHSPGHVALVGEGLAIVGDVLFQGSIGRTDLLGGSHPALMASIRSQLLTLPDETQVLPGHGPVTSIGEERRFNPFLR